MNTSLNQSSLNEILTPLKKANTEFAKKYPGESDQRQPVHTVYGGAQLFKYDTARKIGENALKALSQYAADAETLSRVFHWSHRHVSFAQKIHDRVSAKLKNEAVEDFRIDFEDGYGNRPDKEEDTHAESAAIEVAKGMKEGTLPPFIGIRLKPLSEELSPRSIRTADIFITTLLKETGGKLPANFVITLAKVTIVDQVTAFVKVLSQLEKGNNIPHGSLKIELMVETLQSIFAPSGEVALQKLVAAAEGRCIGAHFGTYDYTASCNITANYQTMNHIACDFAKNVMTIALGGTGIMLSDGATNVMPVGNDPTVIHNAWRLSASHIKHSLQMGYYQGWDLHPAQLPARYATMYAFFLEGIEAATARLKNFMDKAAQATLVGDVFDDAATGQGLLNYFLRGMSCGAVTEAEVLASGLTLEELRTRSFVKILKMRTKS